MTFEEYKSEKGYNSHDAYREYAKKGILEEAYEYGYAWWSMGADQWRGDFYTRHDYNTPCYVVPETWEEAKQVMSNANDWPYMDGDGWTISKLLSILEDSDSVFAADLCDEINDAEYAGAYEGWASALADQKRLNHERCGVDSE